MGIYLNTTDEDKFLESIGMSDPSAKKSCQELFDLLTPHAAKANPHVSVAELFRVFDRAKKGTISTRELSEVFKNLSETLSDDEQKALCELCDKDGSINYTQLIDKLTSGRV